MTDRSGQTTQPLGLLGNGPSPEGNGVPRGTVQCRTVVTGGFHHRHHIRDLPPIGGERDGGALLRDEVQPNPSEMLLTALGSCLAISIHANAVARAIPIRHLEMESKGDVNPAALWRTGDPRVAPLGFESISIRVRIVADAPRDVIKALIDHAVLWSPVANTLYNPVHLDIELAAEPL